LSAYYCLFLTRKVPHGYLAMTWKQFKVYHNNSKTGNICYTLCFFKVLCGWVRASDRSLVSVFLLNKFCGILGQKQVMQYRVLYITLYNLLINRIVCMCRCLHSVLSCYQKHKCNIEHKMNLS
jgi:hypothetical protein